MPSDVDDATSLRPVPPPLVFVALFDYDPVESSPNEQPELELSFKTGDYIFVTETMDEVVGICICFFIRSWSWI